MKLLVHGLGIWVAAQAAAGRYPPPLAAGLSMLVARLGTPTALIALAGLALSKLDDAGAFRPAPRRHRQSRSRRIATPAREP